MAPSLGPNTIQPVAALSSTASASSSIYSRLDAHTLLPLDSSVALIGRVGAPVLSIVPSRCESGTIVRRSRAAQLVLA